MSDRTEVQSVAVIDVEHRSEPLLVLRCTAELACRLADMARRNGQVLEVLLEDYGCTLEITDAPALERLAQLVDFDRLRLPEPKFAEILKAEEAERYLRRDEYAGCCPKCRRPVPPGRRHCFPCATGRRK